MRTEGWSSWVEVLPLAENRGFAAGNNAALQRLLNGPSVPQFIWLLNPDTVVRQGSLQPLVEFLETHPQVGIVGSRLEDPDGTPQRSALPLPNPCQRTGKWPPAGKLSPGCCRAIWLRPRPE